VERWEGEDRRCQGKFHGLAARRCSGNFCRRLRPKSVPRYVRFRDLVSTGWSGRAQVRVGRGRRIMEEFLDPPFI
jgi:hypothetical protein